MRILSLVLLIFISVTTLVAKEKVNYLGKIVDFETKQPIELVAVFTNSASTISNAEGEYELKSEIAENIIFSHISYYSESFNPQDLPDIIELKPKIFELAEILVIPQDVIINELKVVWNNYNKLLNGKKEKDFPESSYYYRQLTFNNDVCVEYIESFFAASTSPLLKSFSLEEGRYARINRDSVHSFTNYFNYSRLSPVSLKKAETQTVNVLLCKDFEQYYNVTLNGILSPGQSDEIRVYEFQPKGENMIKNSIFLSGLLFVKMEDQIIVRAELHSNSLGLSFSNNVSVLNENHKFIVSYQAVPSSFPMIASVSHNSSIHLKSDESICNINIQSTLIPTNLTFTKKRKSLKFQDDLFLKILKSEYNEKFWNENTVVKRTKIEQQVLNIFNSEGYFGTMNLDNN